MERYIIVERYADNGELSHRALVDSTDGRELGTDGGEPEDQSFWRDWAWVPDELNNAQATVEALQRELRLSRFNQANAEAEYNGLQVQIRTLTQQLDAEREKVKGLHEITKVICTHCCEPMEIPSKAALQTQSTQLQALVRALPVLSEVTSDTVVNLVQQYSFHAWMLRALQLRATLDATMPATKGGDGE